jgi:peptidoglycan/xylan/chitin deacetylase (PgdA/CDA1 family)
MRYPQALICFAVLCLCVGALGGVVRMASAQQLAGLQSPAFVADESPQVERLPHPDCNAKPCLVLSFDDGPHEIVTTQVLDILKRYNIKATFFVVGSRVASREALLQREYREGHEIGNHSWSHPDLTKLSPVDAERQITDTQRAIAGAGVPAPQLLRPPYGAIDNMVASRTKLTVVRWNIDPEDWGHKDPAAVQQNILAHARPGAIILLHDIDLVTVAALDPAIVALQSQYQFVTVSQLLDLSPGDQGQYFGRGR